MRRRTAVSIVALLVVLAPPCARTAHGRRIFVGPVAGRKIEVTFLDDEVMPGSTPSDRAHIRCL